jgi:acetyl esterase/lipase
MRNLVLPAALLAVIALAALVAATGSPAAVAAATAAPHAGASPAGGTTAFGWSVDADSEVDVEPDVIYRRASGAELKADIYTPYPAAGPTPTIITIHGGGWVEGTKDGATLSVLPYLERGFAVVNIGYRLGRVAEAPAAVEDARCALRWVVANAERYHFDPQRIVVMGWSAGGHLALTTGLLPASAGFDNTCPAPDATRWGAADMPEVKVAAVVNWFGITDVADLLAGPDAKHYAIEWLGSRADRMELARRVSPMTYVRAGAPPVITIHGDADPYVPYSHATRLHQALDKAGVPNRLVTVPKGGHGGFTRAERRTIYAAIFSFLGERGLMPAPAAAPDAAAQ